MPALEPQGGHARAHNVYQELHRPHQLALVQYTMQLHGLPAGPHHRSKLLALIQQKGQLTLNAWSASSQVSHRRLALPLEGCMRLST